jgi:Cys-tRNA(Pro)/Cys-tRNA(Cys) deacylase
MSRTTPATLALTKAGVDFTVHAYDYDPDAASIGLAAAEALGEDPGRVLKTLMALVDGKPVLVVAPSDREVAMKKLAAAVGGKSATMMKPADAERISGYKVGGISPFGQRKPLPVVIETDALAQPYVYINGGQRGLQVRLDPKAALAVLKAVTAPVSTAS